MVDDIVQRACKVHDETGYVRLLIDEIERLRNIIADMQQAQTYRYIGKDGKSILARDLEDQRDLAIEALTELARDPRKDGVAIGDGWAFYEDSLKYADEKLAEIRSLVTK